MTEDPQNQSGAADGPSDPLGPAGEREDKSEQAFRPFKSWASAYEQRSIWARMRDGISGIFRKRPSQAELTPTASLETPSTDAPAMEAEPMVPVAPPEDFRFPWTRPDIAQETFASVDEALPKGELSGEEEAEEPLSVEVYKDRIDAAASALDVASDTAFTPGRDTLPAPENEFDSVDTALPFIENAPPAAIEESPPAVVAETPPAIVEAKPVSDPFAETLDPVEVVLSPPSTEDVVPPEPPSAAPVIELDVQPTTDEFEIRLGEPTEDETVVDRSYEHKIDTLTIEKKSIWSDSFVRKLFRRRSAAQVEKVATKADEAAEGSAVFLLAKFRAFYNEIIRFKHQKSEFAAGFATAILTEDNVNDSSPALAAEALSKRLTELLELQVAEAKWMGGEVALRYPDAQFAMAALADEIFSNLEWEGQAAWENHRIERKLYQTNAADVDVFRRMDRLLKELPDSAIARDLARVYLLVIAAGFRGKYRPFGLTRALAEYRRRLYEYVHNGDPLLLYAEERIIFPDAASRTQAGQAISRFSAMERWTAILVVLVVTYTVIAHLAWTRASADLKDVTGRIKSANVTGSR